MTPKENRSAFRRFARDEKAVIASAVNWWKGKRPLSRGLRFHLENPRVNCMTEREIRLAKSVARYIKETKGYRYDRQGIRH